MTAKLLSQFKMGISDYRLIPYKGGCFEVAVDGELIYSKLQTGKFPDEKAIVDAVAKRMKQAG